jgi:hypothetical protein
MAAASANSSAFDTVGMLEKVRSLLDRSRVFRGTQISLSQVDLGGEVRVDVGFGGGPALCRIVAPSLEKAYGVLYEFALSVAETEDLRQRRHVA